MSTQEIPPPPPPAVPASEDHTVAILSYITIIGFIVAIVMHSSKKTALGSYHLRQALGLFITWFCGVLCLAIIPIVGWFLIPFYILTMVIMAVLGIVAAVNGKLKPLPVLGTKYEKWFAGAFL